MPHQVLNNADAGQFEVREGGRVAVLQYEMTGDAITFTHTIVPRKLEGQGIGSALARTGLNYARELNLAVIPQCPFVRAYIKRHPEYQSLVRT
jgi:predicted GNAT family acetyltransferase